MATHTSILAWKIPWTEDPGGLQSMRSQRVGLDWVTNTALCLWASLPASVFPQISVWLSPHQILALAQMLLLTKAVVAQLVKNHLQCRRREFDPWVRKIPWRRKWQSTPVFLPGKSMDRGAWWVPVHGVIKIQTWLSMWHTQMHIDTQTHTHTHTGTYTVLEQFRNAVPSYGIIQTWSLLMAVCL